MIDVVLDDLERTVQLVLRDAEQSDIGSVLLLGRPGNDKRQMIPFYSLVDSSLEIISPGLDEIDLPHAVYVLRLEIAHDLQIHDGLPGW